MKKAKEHEKKRDEARAIADAIAALGSDMGMAITFFQVSVALGGICLIVKKKWLWFASLGLGAFAAFKMLTVLNAVI